MAQTHRNSEQRIGGGQRENPRSHEAVFVRSAEYWSLSFGGATFSLKDIKGLSYLQDLLLHPGEELHALDLMGVAGAAGGDDASKIELNALPAGVTVRVGVSGDLGELLDSRAKQEYYRRLQELRERLDDLHERGEQERADEVEAEIEFLSREIARAVGLGGRDRRAGSAAERARLNVTRAIKSAIQRISEHDSAMGAMLDRTIKTGSFCSYAQDPLEPVSWRFSTESSAAKRPPETTAAPPAPSRLRSFLHAFTGGTAFVGRKAERASLDRALEHALRGEGRILLIDGPAGVGKTRIAAELGVQASARGMLTLAGSCFERDDPMPFAPFVEILEGAIVETRDPGAVRAMLGGGAAEISRLLPQLRRQFPDIPAPMELPPDQSLRLLFGAVADLIARVAGDRPMLLLLDDLQWADEGSLLLLHHIAQLVPQMPVVLVGTYRDFDLDPGGQLARTIAELIRLHLVERVKLGGLSESAVGEMLRALSGRKPPQPVVRLLHSDTDGNPFFVEELFSHLVEQGKLIDSAGEFRQDLKLSDADLPPTVRLVIGRRLARLGENPLKILGAAAVIGRSFTFDLLAASIKADPDSVLDSVEVAESAGLISSAVEYPEARFRFSHALIRQAVVSQMSPARRQRMHLDIADAIERLYPDSLEDHVNDLAHHLWQAGAFADAGRTAAALEIAARRALEQGALSTAEGYYRQALDVLGTTPETSDRDRRELALQLALGQVYSATRGYIAPETSAAYDRASMLSEKLGDQMRVVLALGGLFGLPLLRGETQATQVAADRVQRVADRSGLAAARTYASFYQGVSSYHRGALNQAWIFLNDAFAIYREDDHRGMPQDPGVEILDYTALTAWQLGMPDKADATMRDALSLSERIHKPFALAHSRFFAAYLQVLLRDPAQCQKFSEMLHEQSTEQALPLFFDISRILRGWALAHQGRCAEGVSSAREGLAGFMAEGYRLSIGSFFGFFAEALDLSGEHDEALAAVERGMSEVGEQLVDLPYLWWLRGELRLSRLQQGASEAKGAADAIESSFRESISIAERLGAKTCAARARASLARLLDLQSLSKERQQVVVPQVKRD